MTGSIGCIQGTVTWSQPRKVFAQRDQVCVRSTRIQPHDAVVELSASGVVEDQCTVNLPDIFTR